ncbi:MAG: response regulator transcription factor [Pseudomonadota bacterium]
MTRPAKADQKQGWLLIIDDHPLFCDALELTFRSMLPDVMVKTADTLGKAKSMLADTGSAPMLVALDLNLPDVSGAEGVIEMTRAAQNAPIIVVSSLADPKVISTVAASGARGFVPKHSARQVFEEAIAEIRAGRSYFPKAEAEASDTDQTGPDAAERLSLLTAQQARILQLICEGKLNKQIAFELSIAETTVKAHITAIMRKLGVQSRTQAVLVAQDVRFSSILSQPES